VIDAGAAYLEVQERLAALVAGLGAAELQRPAPACPGWTVVDVLAHHVGVVSDVVAGGPGEIGDLDRLLDQWRDPDVARDRDTMSARQVAERRGRSVDDLLREWRDAAEVVVPILSGTRPLPEGLSPIVRAVLVNDVVVHEDDVRRALGLGAAPEVPATSLALAGYGASFEMRRRQQGLPTLAFAYDGRTRLFGDGEPAATVTADRTTLVRLLASRLPEDAIRALDWSGDPTVFVPVLPEYGPAHPD